MLIMIGFLEAILWCNILRTVFAALKVLCGGFFSWRVGRSNARWGMA